MRVEKSRHIGQWILDQLKASLTIYSKERLSELCNRLGLIFDEIKSPTLSGKWHNSFIGCQKSFVMLQTNTSLFSLHETARYDSKTAIRKLNAFPLTVKYKLVQ